MVTPEGHPLFNLGITHLVAGCIGFHLCGAYLRNKARRYGLLDEQEKPDAENVALITAANRKATQWMKTQE